MDFVEQLKSSIDIVKVIGEYVRLKRLGATGRYVGLCPFHQEKTGSFSVNQSRQFYKCFGCGVGGDVLKFVMEIDGLTFPEALKMLAESHGIPMPKRSEFADADSKLRAALFEIYSMAAQMFRENLRGTHGTEARNYLHQRGIGPESIEAFELGFSEPSGQALVRALGEKQFTREQIDASKIVLRREDGSGSFDFFRGRLMFPIHNEAGKVIAFGGRAMRDQDQPKYLNSGETPIYKKTSVLYNLHRARDTMRRSNRAVLVEGYMDVIGVYSAGVKEVVASCGTGFTPPQAGVLHRHSDHVVVNFDPDRAGAEASEKAIQILLDEGVHVRVLTLDGGLDPDEYVKQTGADAYRAKLDSASTYFHWLADRARQKFDMRSSDGRMEAFRFLLPSVQKIGDKLERAAIANDLAGYLGVDAGLVLDQFKKAATDRRGPKGVPAKAAPKEAVSVPAIENILLQTTIASAEVRAEILPLLTPGLIGDFATREIFETMRAMEEAGSEVTFSGLDGRLSPALQTLLHSVLAADDIDNEGVSLEAARACLRKLESGAMKRRVDELRARVRSAEREGRMAEALELMGDLARLEKEVKPSGGELRLAGVVH
ncbi:MAG TPA: DNA primase [Bryobacteraceae bacterium]|jgi:DNA primase|nr:DNA primase [Bryobacteraceae bacterium]